MLFTFPDSSSRGKVEAFILVIERCIYEDIAQLNGIGGLL